MNSSDTFPIQHPVMQIWDIVTLCHSLCIQRLWFSISTLESVSVVEIFELNFKFLPTISVTINIVWKFKSLHCG